MAAAKSALRRDVLARRRAMGGGARGAASAVICGKIRAQPAYQKARCVAAFAPMTEEVDIWPLLEESRAAGKTIALPRVADAGARRLAFHQFSARDALVGGYQGIAEPRADAPAVAADAFDCILVPAVAVAADKTRLGYGGGFYDILLGNLAGVMTFAPIFRCQSVTEMPREKHDRRVDFIITEE